MPDPRRGPPPGEHHPRRSTALACHNIQLLIEDEYNQYGWDFAPRAATTRILQMEEAVELILKM